MEMEVYKKAESVKRHIERITKELAQTRNAAAGDAHIEIYGPTGKVTIWSSKEMTGKVLKLICEYKENKLKELQREFKEL